MKDIDKVKLLGLFLGIAIIMGIPSIISALTMDSLNDDDLHFDRMNVYTLPHVPLGSIVIDSSNVTTYKPLYYRDGILAGWLINNTIFVKESPFDIQISIGYNTTHDYQKTLFK